MEHSGSLGMNNVNEVSIIEIYKQICDEITNGREKEIEQQKSLPNILDKMSNFIKNKIEIVCNKNQKLCEEVFKFLSQENVKFICISQKNGMIHYVTDKYIGEIHIIGGFMQRFVGPSIENIDDKIKSDILGIFKFLEIILNSHKYISSSCKFNSDKISNIVWAIMLKVFEIVKDNNELKMKKFNGHLLKVLQIFNDKKDKESADKIQKLKCEIQPLKDKMNATSQENQNNDEKTTQDINRIINIWKESSELLSKKSKELDEREKIIKREGRIIQEVHEKNNEEREKLIAAKAEFLAEVSNYNQFNTSNPFLINDTANWCYYGEKKHKKRNTNKE